MLRASVLTSSLRTRIRTLACFALCVCASVSLPRASTADSFLVFGPETFLRDSAQPETFQRSFVILNPNTTFTLQIYNGGADGTLPSISSATVELNGIEIVRRNEWNQNVELIERQVSPLSGENSLVLKLSSTPGGTVLFRIVGLDDEPPSIHAAVDPSANGSGWHRTDVTVSFECSDGISGIASCPEPVVVSTEGVGQVVSGTAVDHAGNQTTTSVTLNIDKTPPALASSLSPEANAAGWNNADVTVSFECSDALSGIASCPQPRVASMEAAGQIISGTAIDQAGNEAEASVNLNIDKTPPSVSITSPSDGAVLSSLPAAVSGTVIDTLSGIASATCNGLAATMTGTNFTCDVPLSAGLSTITVTATDLAENIGQASVSVTLDAGQLVAPPVDRSVATDIASSTEFLYTGANPVQTGVAPGTIEPRRVAVLRGKVLERDGSPLAGVTVQLLNRPEFGSTLTRQDGFFDMAVNGGGPLVLDYSKAGYLGAQRQIHAHWRDFAHAPDVALISLDPEVTEVEFGPSAISFQVARGSVEIDDSGMRQATLLFPPETEAVLELPGGGTLPVETLHVRATEYTVGPNGRTAMPAELPPTTAYTYAVELSADEAIAAGAQTIRFSQPVYVYVENYRDFPVGIPVPVGFYDRSDGLWKPSSDGRIIEVLDTATGLAILDIDGSGLAASPEQLAALGITAEEQSELAAIYGAGQSLWRVPVEHFSPCDFNWPSRLLGGASPTPWPISNGDPVRPCDFESGSIIDCLNQTLGEVIGISGTSLSLHYQSDRAHGRTAANMLAIPLDNGSIPPELNRIEVEVEVAGQHFVQSFPAQANQIYTYTWDGKDAYGRLLQGAQPATVRIGYVYQALFGQPVANLDASFGSPSSTPIAPFNEAGEEVRWSTQRTSVGGWDASAQGLGGWSVSAHHVYDPESEVLYFGHGARRNAHWLGLTIATAAGGGTGGDGSAADAAELDFPRGVIVGPEGSLYIAEPQQRRVRRVSPDGIITTIAGSGSYGTGGDGGPATQAEMVNPRILEIGLDGSLYIADGERIRRVSLDGIITTVAGSEHTYFSGDGGPARQAVLFGPNSIAHGPDGSLYIADTYNYRIRRVTPDGIITTIAGTGNRDFSGDGGPAIDADLDTPVGLAVGSDGSVYFTDSYNERVRKVSPNGTIDTIAGNGDWGYSGDGGPATQATLSSPEGVGHGMSVGHEYLSGPVARGRRASPLPRPKVGRSHFSR
jgi:hypothetical protein